MRVALATCSNLPDREVDDQPLHRALVEHGVEITHAVWDDPAIDWRSFDACLIRTTWDYMDRPAEYIRWARRVGRLTRLFNDAGMIEWNIRKTYVRELEAAGMPVAPTEWLEPGDAPDIAAIMSANGWTRGFLKPVVGATARETLRFDADDVNEAQQHLDRVLQHEAMMMQPYLSRVETDGEYSAIFIDGVFTHGVRKVPVAGDYRVQDDFGASDEPYDFSADELALATRVIDHRSGHPLYARVDFLRDDSGSFVVTELELIEPSLFFRHNEDAAAKLATALIDRTG